MIYIHVRRFAPNLAETTLYMPSDNWRPRICLLTPARLLELWRAAKAEGDVKLFLYGRSKIISW